MHLNLSVCFGSQLDYLYYDIGNMQSSVNNLIVDEIHKGKSLM